MDNAEFMRWSGFKELVDFLADAIGDFHDAAVYDTGYEFDPDNVDALIFIAAKAMTKASLGKEEFCAPMPQDGSVVPLEEKPDNPKMLRAYLDRKECEKNAKFTYIPMFSLYVDKVEKALRRRNIPYEDMTAEEKLQDEQELASINKELKRTSFFIHFIYAVYIILVFFGFSAFARACSAVCEVMNG